MATWVVDERPARRVGLTGDGLVNVARALGHEVVTTAWPYETGRAPDAVASVLADGRPLLLRGSVGFAAWAHGRWRVRPGAFPHPTSAAGEWLAAYGPLALNCDAVVVTAAEFDARRAALEEQLGGALFVKPADASKRLSGTVLDPGRPLFDAHYAAHRRWDPLPEDFRLLVARAQPLVAEWRFVIAGTQVVAASRYCVGRALDFSPGAPVGAAAAAAAVAEHPWRPAEVFVSDVCELADPGRGYRLLELNTFGTAGLYACDLEAIVQSVSVYAE